MAVILAAIGGGGLVGGGEALTDGVRPLLLIRAEAVQRFTRSFIHGYAGQMALLTQSLAAGAAPAELLRGVVARDPLIVRVQLVEKEGLAWRVERAEEGVRLVQAAPPFPSPPVADPVGRMVISGPDLEGESTSLAAGTPTMHFVQRVSGDDRRVVMLTVEATPLLEDSAIGGSKSFLQRAVLDEEGYWLSGVGPERLFGMRRDRHATLALENAPLWGQIRERGTGQYAEDGRLWAFARIDLAALSGLPVADAPVWYDLQIAHVPAGGALSFVQQLGGAGVGLAGLIVLGLVIDHRRHRRQAIVPRRSERIEVLGALAIGLHQALAPALGNAVTLVSGVRPLAATLRQPSDALLPGVLAGVADRIDMGLGEAGHALDRAGLVLERLRDIGAVPSPFPRRLFDLDEVVLAVAEMVRPRFRTGSHQLKVEAGARAHLEGSPDVLRQVLEELLDNASRHGLGERPLGEVILRSAPGPGGNILISVADDGAGMPPDVEARAFEPFFSTQPGALGLGLCVVEALTLQRLGGQVSLVSSPGEGTRVTLILPRRAPEPDLLRNKEPA